jgi:hypothetical protein
MAAIQPPSGIPPIKTTLSQLTCLCQLARVIGWSVICGLERGLGARFSIVSRAGELIAGGIARSKDKKNERRMKEPTSPRVCGRGKKGWVGQDKFMGFGRKEKRMNEGAGSGWGLIVSRATHRATLKCYQQRQRKMPIRTRDWQTQLKPTAYHLNINVEWSV